MGIKSKLFGFGAASLLALSMTTGVMAQATDTDTSNLGVELKAGACSLTITAGTSIDFGDYRWNGSGTYEFVSGSSSTGASISGEIKNHKPGGLCRVTVATTGLHSGNSVIRGQNIVGTIPGVGSADLGVARSGNVGPGTYSGSLSLHNVETLGAAPGTYTGTLNFTLSNAN